MPSSDPRGPDETQPGWRRSNWLAEKVRSGELPAPADENERRCDEIFLEDGDLDEHVQVMAAKLSGAPGETAAAAGRRVADLRAYLHRLLVVREMWSRERC